MNRFFQDAMTVSGEIEQHKRAIPERSGAEYRPLLLGVGFAILLGIVAASAWMAYRVQAEATAAAAARETEIDLSEVLLALRRAESSQRGYLLTDGDPTYAAGYQATVERALAAVQNANASAGDNPAFRAAVADLEPLVRRKLDELAETIRLQDSGDRSGALALVRSGRGQQLMNQVRERVDAMRTEQQRLQVAQTNEFARSSRLLLFATFGGTIVVTGLALVVWRLTQNSRRDLERAYTAVEEANRDLEARVAVRTAELRDANDEIQRFAYIVGHDLRAPLVNIMGFTSELQALRDDLFGRLEELGGAGDNDADRKLGEDFAEALGFIKAAIAKMDRLINAILKLSREGRRVFNPELVDMSALLRSIAASLQHQVDAADAVIAIDSLPPAFSDRIALEQIFSNLLDNGLKYLRRNEPGRIHVRGCTVASALVYEVEDNGRGIGPEDLERIFELFRRAGAQDRPGEGIGLAHVRALVRRLGGTITLSSQVGRGSTFTVRLPRQFKDAQEKAA